MDSESRWREYILNYIDECLKHTLQGKWKDVWWLELQKTVVGYWPSKIFKGGLGQSASYGGEVYYPKYYQGGDNGLEMGSGYSPDNTLQDNAFCYNLRVVDKDHKLGVLDPRNTVQFANYNVTYSVSQESLGQGQFNNVVVFGGITHTNVDANATVFLSENEKL